METVSAVGLRTVYAGMAVPPLGKRAPPLRLMGPPEPCTYRIEANKRAPLSPEAWIDPLANKANGRPLESGD